MSAWERDKEDKDKTERKDTKLGKKLLHTE